MKQSGAAGRHGMAALSLEKFASAKNSSHNKRELLKKQHLKKLNKVGKYKRLLNRLEGAPGKGAPAAVEFRDRVAELEDQFFIGEAAQQPAEAPQKKKKRDRQAGQPAQAIADGKQPVQPDEAIPAATQHVDAGPTASKQQPQQRRQQRLPEQQQQHEDLHVKQKQHGGKQPSAAVIQASAEPSTKRQKSMSAVQQQQDSDDATVLPAHEQGKAKPATVGHASHTAPASQGGTAAAPQAGGKAAKRHAAHRPPSRMQRLLEEQQAQRGAQEQEKKQAQQAKAERQTGIQEAQKHRRVEKQQYFKRTRTGQPLMRFRMEKILNTLLHENKH